MNRKNFECKSRPFWLLCASVMNQVAAPSFEVLSNSKAQALLPNNAFKKNKINFCIVENE